MIRDDINYQQHIPYVMYIYDSKKEIYYPEINEGNIDAIFDVYVVTSNSARTVIFLLTMTTDYLFGYALGTLDTYVVLRRESIPCVKGHPVVVGFVYKHKKDILKVFQASWLLVKEESQNLETLYQIDTKLSVVADDVLKKLKIKFDL